MANEATLKGLHIRNGGDDTHKGMWQAWDGETYLAGANGPMSLFVMGAFLDSIFDGRYHQPGKESNPGIKWLPPII